MCLPSLKAGTLPLMMFQFCVRLRLVSHRVTALDRLIQMVDQPVVEASSCSFVPHYVSRR